MVLSTARQISVFICLIDAGKWTGAKLRQLGSLVKGLDTTDIKKLGKEAFEEAVGVWGKYLDVDMETLEALAEKAKEVRPNTEQKLSNVFLLIHVHQSC